MSLSLIILNWLTFAWLLGWAIRAILDIGSTQRRSVSFLLLVFFVFYGIPIFLDLIFGIPDYDGTPGFLVGATTSSVAVVYDLFVAVCPPFWWFTARSQRQSGDRLLVFAGKKAQKVLWLLLASPVIALVFAPQPGVYLTYGAVLGANMSVAASAFHGIIGGLSILSLVAGTGLLLFRHNFGRSCLLVLPFVTASIWLEGKRTIVALCIVLFWAVAWMRGLLTQSRLITFGACTLIAFGGYVAWYQLTFRPTSVANSYSVYENSRVDYGRDHDLKAAIYCELKGDDQPILEYRGQSILFYLTMYVPRSRWPEKPWPYAVYVTAHALQISATDIGWGLTSSFLDEAVANFGWLGLLVGPLAFALLCRICDHSPDPFVKVVGVLVACLLMSVELAAFAPLVIAWAFYLGWSQRVLRGVPRRLSAMTYGHLRTRT